MSFNEQEIQEFKTEVIELLDIAEKSLLALDGGAEFKPTFDTIFRSLHNIKGAAGMMELQSLQAHTHELETIFMRFKEETTIPKGYINMFLRGIDAARSMFDGGWVNFSFAVTAVEAVKPLVPEVTAVDTKPASESEKLQGPDTRDALDSSLNEFVCECDDIVERLSKNLQLIEVGNHTRESVDALYRDVHSLKGTAYLFSFAKLGDLGHAMESSLEKVRASSHAPSKDLLNLLFKSLKLIELLVEKVRKKSSDDDLEKVVVTMCEALTLASENLEEILGSPRTPLPTEKVVSQDGSSIRVPISLLDNLMTLMGEMVLVRNQVLQFSKKSEDLEFLSMSKRLNVVTSEIQAEMMKTRMQPIGNVFSKFNRLVRDLSQELKKNLDLTLSGVETELDKSLLEAIKDPLTHIVRNSCDHGIETPEIRKRSGKAEKGTISIKAYHEGGQVVIEVSDDGKGLHKDVILRKAIEKGIVSQAQSAKLSDKEIFNIIFAPGFSTAAQVTNVSGRGVGMDVVRTNIERIGGTVDLSSITGVGTMTKIKIPLTLAIVPALIIKCGSGAFAIPQVKLEELVRVDPTSENKIEMLHGTPVYRLRGNILPLVDLNKVLGIRSKTGIDNAILNIAVLNAERCSFGLIIDEIQDTADIVVKPLNRLLKSLQIYSGATVMGDGSIALILDVLGLSKVAQIGHEALKENNAELQKIEKSRKASEIQDFLLVKVGTTTKHALVLNYVNRLEEFKKSEVEFSGNQKVIRYRGAILPLISTNVLLGYAPAPDQESVPTVVIERAGKLFGLQVHEILDTLSTETETDTSFSTHPCIFGNLSMDTELIVVIDPFEIISKAFPEQVVVLPTQEIPARTIAKTQGLELNQTSYKVKSARKILLVEDTAFFRRAIKDVLEKGGYEVAMASDGQEAMELLGMESASFDMIVSDIEMPRLNGFQLATQVRKHPKFSTLPMLAISSRADRKYMNEGSKAGFDVYLEKLKPGVLLNAVSELFGKIVGAA